MLALLVIVSPLIAALAVFYVAATFRCQPAGGVVQSGLCLTITHRSGAALPTDPRNRLVWSCLGRISSRPNGVNPYPPRPSAKAS